MTVFISYSRRDTELVSQLYADLLDQGIQVWFDRDAIEAGTLWRTSIVDGIQACRVFLLVLSASSQQSINVAKEVSLAESNSKPIVPLKIDDTPILPDFSYSLAGIQFVDMSNKGYASSLREILEAIQRLAPESRAVEPKPAAPHGAGVPVAGFPPRSPGGAEAAAPPSPRISPAPAASTLQATGAPASPHSQNSTPLDQGTLARVHQLVIEELGPVVDLLWSHDFAHDLLIRPEATVAKLVDLGVPEATAVRLHKRLEPYFLPR